MWIRRSVLVALAGLGLSSCLVWSPQTLTTYPRLGCEVESQKHLDGIDWSKADIVDIRVRDNEFSPMVVRMTQSRPYLLRVRNRDDYRHYFTAWTFFNSVAVARVAIDGEEVEDTCFAALTLQKGQVVEMQLVAVDDGSYAFYDSISLVSAIPPYGANGVITIEEPEDY